MVKIVDKVTIDKEGTAIGSSIITAIHELQQQENKAKHIILLTDGANNAGAFSPYIAAEIARMYGIRLHIVGVCDTEDAPYPLQTSTGTKYQQIAPNIDEKQLQEIARITGGDYFRTTNNRELQDVFEKIHAAIYDKTKQHTIQTPYPRLSQEKARQIIESVPISAQ